MKKLKGKNCLLTGAASGIGRCLAILLAKEGMNLFLVDIDIKGLEKVKEEIEAIGAVVRTSKCDVSKLEEIQRIAGEFYQEFGKLNLLINNAGVAGGGFYLSGGPLCHARGSGGRGGQEYPGGAGTAIDGAAAVGQAAGSPAAGRPHPLRPGNDSGGGVLQWDRELFPAPERL